MESFSQKIKSEILGMPIKSYKNICQELSAIFTFSGNTDNSNTISLPSKNTCTVARVLKLTEFALNFQNNESEFRKIILRYNLDFKPQTPKHWSEETKEIYEKAKTKCEEQQTTIYDLIRIVIYQFATGKIRMAKRQNLTHQKEDK